MPPHEAAGLEGVAVAAAPDDEPAFDPLAMLEAFQNQKLGPALAELEPAAIERLRAHVDEVCESHGMALVIAELDITDSYAEPHIREIHVPAIRSELGYLVALHEAGHIVLGLPSHEEHSDGTMIERFFANEAAAWEWAIDYALDAPTEAATEAMKHLVSSDDPGEGLDEARARLAAAVARRRAGDGAP